MKFLFLVLIIPLKFCSSENNQPVTISVKEELRINDTILELDQTKIWILNPTQKIKGDILVLPGWNFSYDSICKVSSFCDDAKKYGYRLILPDMKKSVYASKYYRETKSLYKIYKTSTWIVDTMIPYLQSNWKIFTSNTNILHGISTGARGAAIIHLKTDTLFKKVVLLSGDYDQTKMPNDNLMKNTYGNYSDFTERWETEDNVIHQLNKWKADVLIAHSTQDNVVPFEQSEILVDSLKNKNIKLVTSFMDGKHDWAFWNEVNKNYVWKFLE